MPAILLGGRGMLQKALGLYAVAFIIVAIVAKAAIVGIGLPDWVFPGALVVMGLGLPVILFTAYTQYVARRAMTTSPTLTPGGSLALTTHGTMANIAIKASPHLSWRRAALGGVYAVSAFIIAIGVFMVLRAFGIGPAGSLFAKGRLNSRDALIVSDFRVKGADSSLGSVVSEAVRTSLAESDVISIVNPTVVAAALGRMQRPTTTPVDLPLAREIAVREGAKAVVDGDVTPLGAGFVLSMRLVTADSGLELATFHETASGPNELLPKLDKLVRALRGRMGESLKRVHADPPLEQVTTRSLEALRKFAEGRRANNLQGDFAKSAALLDQAVALDTGFAMAYRSLGIAYSNLGFPREKSDSAFVKAYRYRDRLTERERYLATANYYEVTRDRGKEIAAYEEYLAHNPHDYAIPNNLALRLEMRRDFVKAESLFRRSLAENPASALAIGNLVRNLVSQGRYDEAAKAAAEFRQRTPSTTALNNAEFFIEYGRRNYDSATSVLRTTRAKTSNVVTKSRTTASLGAVSLIQGRLAAGLQLRREVFVMDSARGAATSPVDVALDSAFVDAWFREQPARAAKTLDEALARHPLKALPVDDRNDFGIASVYAIAARPDRARAILAQYDAEVRDTTIRRDQEPYRHRALADIAIAERRPRDAVNEVRAGDRGSDGPVDACASCTYAALGRAFDLAGMPDSAIASFEASLSEHYSLRYIGNPYKPTLNGDIRHLAGTYKRLGELYEAKGDREKAVTNYTKFVELWKNADPELQPKVAEVKKKLARLDTEIRR
jgi:tetratricopeptide (TPR) repeat protein